MPHSKPKRKMRTVSLRNFLSVMKNFLNHKISKSLLERIINQILETSEKTISTCHSAPINFSNFLLYLYEIINNYKKIQGHKKKDTEKNKKDNFKKPLHTNTFKCTRIWESTHNLSNRDQRDNINQSRKYISKKS